MTISTGLELAVLALDSYNQGYGVNFDPGKQIGDASVILNSRDVFKDGADIASGFSATAYQIGNTVVISYRGTDNPGLAFNSQKGASDIINGWTLGAGIPNTAQAELAREFYLSVRASNPARILFLPAIRLAAGWPDTCPP